MRKYILLVSIVAFMLGACNKNEVIMEQSEGKKVAPQLIATLEQDQTTKSGVIEDNDYILGEKFYWTNGDATTVFFTNPSMLDPQEYKSVKYKANVAPDVQSNNCIFEAINGDNIDNGEYTAYGFFPTSAWDLRVDYMSFLTANIPAYQTQTQANSTHLGAYMLMKAQNTVTVDGSSPINLSYTHLASMLRFAVWNNSGNNDLKLAHINIRLNSGKAVFNTKSKLNDIDTSSLTMGALSSKVPTLSLQLTGDARDFSNKGGKSQCEGYMAVLPTDTDAFESTDDLIIELSLTDGTNNYFVAKTYNIGAVLGFLSNGIEQGKSYYFKLKVDPLDLISPITGTSYAVGDYWPDATNPEGIVFWVKPGSLGTHGKIVGLNENYILRWGPDNNEQAAGVISISSATDGATATKNMITKYKNSGLSNYPAFDYIYTIVNNSNENGVWYLPARDELKMLYAGYSGKLYESITDWSSGDMPDYNSLECVLFRTTFNGYLAAKSGMPIDNEWYWSSSEISEIKSYSLNFIGGNNSIDSKSLGGNIRWIREF